MTNLNVTATAGDAPDAAKLETSAAGDAVMNVDVEAVAALRQSLAEQDAAETAPASGNAADAEAGNDSGDEADGDRNATAGIDEAVTGDGENAVAEAGMMRLWQVLMLPVWCRWDVLADVLPVMRRHVRRS